MACNCAGAAAAQRRRTYSSEVATWELRLSSGQVMTFGSRLEADAENARRNYSGIVTRQEETK